MQGVVEEFADTGIPLWPLVPSVLFSAFLAGETGLASIVAITRDASVHAWGTVLRWWGDQHGTAIFATTQWAP